MDRRTFIASAAGLVAQASLPVSAARAVTLGTGRFSYQAVNWGEIPPGVTISNIFAVAVDRNDNVYIGHQGKNRIMVFDRDGHFLHGWGDDIFQKPHGLEIGPDGSIYCADSLDHTVRKCSPDGKVLLEIGTRGKPAPFMSGLPFNQPTHTALSPRGEIYVSDGYGNARIHKYAPDGRHLTSWGGPGRGPGEFSIPHNIVCDRRGWLYVADRENHRIQLFDGAGRYQGQWTNLHRPCGLAMSAGPNPLFYVGEAAPETALTINFPNFGPRLSILDGRGNILARLANEGAGPGLDHFMAPHGVAIDSRGDVYVVEVSYLAWPARFPNEKPPALPTLRKLIRANR